tara:strand:+ start:5176 stop:5859 length:684 start_codon:yes stop_codon:yes gene_type:complete
MNEYNQVKIGFLVASFVCCVAPTFADTLSVKVGVDAAYSDLDVDVADHSYTYDTKINPSYWIKFEHFIPTLPNIKVQFDDVSTSLEHNLVDHNLKLTQMHYTLYYEVLDNGLVSADVGLNYTSVQGDMSTPQHAEIDLEQSQWAAYISSELAFPGTDFFAFADALVGFDPAAYHDIQAGLGWRVSALADFDTKIGYRYTGIEGEESGTKTDYTLAHRGVFAGVSVSF